MCGFAKAFENFCGCSGGRELKRHKCRAPIGTLGRFEAGDDTLMIRLALVRAKAVSRCACHRSPRRALGNGNAVAALNHRQQLQ